MSPCRKIYDWECSLFLWLVALVQFLFEERQRIHRYRLLLECLSSSNPFLVFSIALFQPLLVFLPICSHISILSFIRVPCDPRTSFPSSWASLFSPRQLQRNWLFLGFWNACWCWIIPHLSLFLILLLFLVSFRPLFFFLFTSLVVGALCVYHSQFGDSRFLFAFQPNPHRLQNHLVFLLVFLLLLLLHPQIPDPLPTHHTLLALPPKNPPRFHLHFHLILHPNLVLLHSISFISRPDA